MKLFIKCNINARFIYDVTRMFFSLIQPPLQAFFSRTLLFSSRGFEREPRLASLFILLLERSLFYDYGL